MSENTKNDLLSGLLRSYRLTAEIYATPAVCGAWQIGQHTAQDVVVFHLIGRGQGWLHQPEPAEPVALRSGDLVVLPHNSWHMITPDPVLRGTGTQLVNDGKGPVTSLVCGALQFSVNRHNPIIDALPDLLLIHADEGGAQLASLARLLVSEAENPQYGQQVVLDKLADVLFTLVIRSHIQHSNSPTGLLAALADRRLGRALQAIHGRPDEAWTVAGLALEAGMSRTAFSNHFQNVLAETPIAYLTRWRMQQAELALRSGHSTVAELSEHYGYQTEAAFRRAFKRVNGIPPGQAKKLQR